MRVLFLLLNNLLWILGILLYIYITKPTTQLDTFAKLIPQTVKEIADGIARNINPVVLDAPRGTRSNNSSEPNYSPDELVQQTPQRESIFPPWELEDAWQTPNVTQQ